jgi:hypothetical protein
MMSKKAQLLEKTKLSVLQEGGYQLHCHYHRQKDVQKMPREKMLKINPFLEIPKLLSMHGVLAKVKLEKDYQTQGLRIQPMIWARGSLGR